MYPQSNCWVALFSLTLSTLLLPVASQNAVPPTAKAPNTFSNGAAFLGGEPVCNDNFPVPDVYGARDVDLPFYRLYHGNMKFFRPGQLNTPTGPTDVFSSQNDDAQQSACGIPDNAFFISKVAIHPYFLKYADLSRYCMQDVCISFWKEDGTSDMILKVTDICSTDPNDPTHCATPADIKIDRSKAKIMEQLNTDLPGDQYPEKVWWFFTKCWADALPQPAYQGNNWFTTPTLPCNLNWSQTTAQKQYDNNQKNYPSKGWPTYPNGGYNPKRDSTTSPEISDWIPGSEPAWSPIAGGKGWGIPNAGSGSSGGSMPVAAVSSSAPVPSVIDSYPATTSSSAPPAGTPPAGTPSATTSSSIIDPGTTPLASAPSATTTPDAAPTTPSSIDSAFTSSSSVSTSSSVQTNTQYSDAMNYSSGQPAYASGNSSVSGGQGDNLSTSTPTDSTSTTQMSPPPSPPANVGDANGDAGPPAGSPAPMVTTTTTHFMSSSVSGSAPYSCACSCSCFAIIPGGSSTMPVVYPASSTVAAIASGTTPVQSTPPTGTPDSNSSDPVPAPASGSSTTPPAPAGSSSDANAGNSPAVSTTPSSAAGMPDPNASTPVPGPVSADSSAPYPANNATSTPNSSDAPMTTSSNLAPPPPPASSSANPGPGPSDTVSGSNPPPPPPTSTSITSAPPPPTSVSQSSAAAQSQSIKEDTCPPKKRKRNHRREHVKAGLRD